MSVEQVAYSYYSIITTINDIKIGRKELSLLTAMALPSFERNKWIEKNKSSIASFYNMKGKLTKRRLLVKGKVNPILLPDFKNLTIEIQLNGKTE